MKRRPAKETRKTPKQSFKALDDLALQLVDTEQHVKRGDYALNIARSKLDKVTKHLTSQEVLYIVDKCHTISKQRANRKRYVDHMNTYGPLPVPTNTTINYGNNWAQLLNKRM